MLIVILFLTLLVATILITKIICDFKTNRNASGCANDVEKVSTGTTTTTKVTKVNKQSMKSLSASSSSSSSFRSPSFFSDTDNLHSHAVKSTSKPKLQLSAPMKQQVKTRPSLVKLQLKPHIVRSESKTVRSSLSPFSSSSSSSLSRTPTRMSTLGVDDTTTALCAPLGDFLTNQLKDVLPTLINAQLSILGPLEYSTKVNFMNMDMNMSIRTGTPFQMGRVFFDAVTTKACSDGTLEINATTTFSTSNISIQIFAEEKISTVTISAELKCTGVLETDPRAPFSPPSVKLTGLSLSELQFSATSRPDITWLVSLASAALTDVLNSELAKIVTPLPPKSGGGGGGGGGGKTLLLKNLPRSEIWTDEKKSKLLRNDTDPVKVAFASFLTRQIQAALTSPLFQRATFKVCDKCPASTFAKIELGEKVWAANSGCAVTLPVVGCGCNYAYHAGVKSLRGLDAMRVAQLQLGSLSFPSATEVRYSFSVHIECKNVSIEVSVGVKPCVGSKIEKNLVVPIPGNVLFRVVEATIDGTYNADTRNTTFSSKTLKLRAAELLLVLPLEWTRIKTNIAVLDAVLGPVFSFVGGAGTGLLQDLMNAIVRKYLNDKIVEVLQEVLTDNLPPIEFPIPGLVKRPLPADIKEGDVVRVGNKFDLIEDGRRRALTPVGYAVLGRPSPNPSTAASQVDTGAPFSPEGMTVACNGGIYLIQANVRHGLSHEAWQRMHFQPSVRTIDCDSLATIPDGTPILK